MTRVGADLLFRTVPRSDYLGFWANQTLNAGAVVDFLSLKKTDVAKMAEVAPSSVRFDHKIPREVRIRLAEIASVCESVAQYFSGDADRTALWFRTPNPLLGNVSPRDMIRYGRYEKLRQFIQEALAENSTAVEAEKAADVIHEAASTAAARS